jgi:SAM-dependent methyltransferase
MPTVSRPNGEPHRQRQTAESFGAHAERYDRARPRYPDALLERITAALPGPDVLDVGCGTGIAARQLQAAGCRVLGVDPDARMAAVARQSGVEVEVAAFEDWDPKGRQYDAVVAGTAWHWVDPLAGAAKAVRVLRPGGLLTPFWNVMRLPAELAEAVAASCQRVMPDAPFDFRALTGSPVDRYATLLVKAAEGIRAAGGFTEPQQWRHDWEQTCTRAALLDQLPTLGLLTRLPPDPLAEVLDAAGAAADAMGGSFTLGFTTVALAATREAAVT